MKTSDWKSDWVGLAAGMRGGPKAVKIKTLQLGEKEAGAGCKPTIHISHEGRERIFFLTTPFIGPLKGVPTKGESLLRWPSTERKPYCTASEMGTTAHTRA